MRRDQDDGRFSAGHDTEAKDRGRPVVLIAAALGVEPEVFRESFSGVKPARDGKPTKEEAEQNKETLMRVLKPHGDSQTSRKICLTDRALVGKMS